MSAQPRALFALAWHLFFCCLTFEPPWSDYGGHLGPSWGHLGLIFEPSCALLDHLGGILAHLSGSPVAKLAGRGIIDPEFFPMLQISQKSTKTKKSWPRLPEKKSGRAAVVPRRGVNPPPDPLWVGATACQMLPQRLPRPMESKCRQYIGPEIFGRNLFSPPYIPPGAPRIPSGSA